ncbi:MAG: DUF2344 domain-containing protein [Eubacterium sp.]|nr:DUF2344 domain-containing protein [Eubacterium sp.]
MNKITFPVRLFFTKTGRAKYISALDLIKCFQRAIRRTDLPIWHTQGFNPHTYVNVNLPLSLGTEGYCESMDLKLNEEVAFDAVAEKLNAVLPADIRITKAAVPVKKHTEIEKSVYKIVTDCDIQKLQEFFGREQIITEKKTKKGIAEIDIKPYIEVSDYGEGEFTLVLPSGCDFTINPSLVFDAYEKLTGDKIETLKIQRMRILCKDGKDFE